MWILFIIIFVALVIGVVILQYKQQKNSFVRSSTIDQRSSVPQKPNQYSYDIVGEQSYQKNLENIAGKKQELA